MEEDEDMEVEEVYLVHEVDLDYEYDAPRYFDFTREESPAEARQVERWFESAKCYPPSPFAAKLLQRDDLLLENDDKISPHCEDVEFAAMVSDSESDRVWAVHQAIQASMKGEVKDCRGAQGRIFGIMQNEGVPEVPNRPTELSKGSRFCNQILSEILKTKAKNAAKSRSSTLMKPTASMLAKHNQPSQVTSSRFNMLPGQLNQRITSISGTERQAAKRQKLEGGHLFKVVEEKQPLSLVHKAPKKDTLFEKTPHQKLRITIPREPDLETAQRAQRTRLKTSSEMEESVVNVRRFKARPLNRKILEAPQLPLSQKSTPRMPEFQLFHLKTSERAMQHTPASLSSSLYCNESDKELHKDGRFSVAENGNKAAGRISASATLRQDGSQFFNFKAHPLNKKEFKFHMEKRTEHDLSAELFSKLSLKSELQPSNQPMKSPRPPCSRVKGSKENRFSSVPHKHEVAHSIKEKLPPYGRKQFNHGIHEAGGAVGPNLGMRYADTRS
ncbi:hypothetical protein CDL15_Pgr003831 [Punica granatum]|uniref:TPX2 central domain-containing protein n=1 Tax=Punica granatum TaxID=22663 RepID=A0A218XUY7_PUNGR|nr:hypothetical protein CDL15_Pgr003831 [Punica granatum]